MVKVQIGPVEKDWTEVDQHWVCNEIQGRRNGGCSDCVVIRVQDGEVDLVLATPGCSSGGVPRPLRGREERIIELWRKLHLDKVGFSCGNVNAFLKQLRQIL